jgi:hypothetical protein
MHDKLVFGSVALSAAVLIGGCVGRAGGYAEVDAPVVFTAEPTLVLVEPGIWVVRDYDYSVYYVDDYYWVYRDDVWYRSRTYDGGWATVEVSTVPRPIFSRDHRAYVHYHGGPSAPARSAPHERGNDRGRPARVDEHRDQPDRRRDEVPRGPERADDRHDAPHDRRPDEDHAGDRHAAQPPHDDGRGADSHGDQQGRPDNGKREDHEKADDGKRDEKRKQNNDHQQRGDKNDHDKR